MAGISLLVFTTFSLILLSFVTAQPGPSVHHIVCRPFGPCSPCPEDALLEPFCQPFGNRRLVHCTSLNVTSTTNYISGDAEKTNNQLDPQGETPAWEACGRIVDTERADFWEFLVSNLLLGAVACTIVYIRERRLEASRARTLAARIGLVNTSSVR